MARISITWASDGSIHWEDWWVQRHGHIRTRQPGEKEHVGFANYDLQKNGLPKLAPTDDGNYVIVADQVDYADVKHLLEYHGFAVAPFPS